MSPDGCRVSSLFMTFFQGSLLINISNYISFDSSFFSILRTPPFRENDVDSSSWNTGQSIDNFVLISLIKKQIFMQEKSPPPSSRTPTKNNPPMVLLFDIWRFRRLFCPHQVCKSLYTFEN